MAGLDLTDILNDVSRCAAELAQERCSAPPIDELDAFAQTDPLLASLQKQYRDARDSRLRAMAEYGTSDGMTELAALSEDSAWCAMQTRYLELRASKETMMRAVDFITQTKAQVERDRESRQRSKILDFLSMVQTARLCGDDGSALIFGWLLLCFEDQLIVTFRAPPSISFNRLAA